MNRRQFLKTLGAGTLLAATRGGLAAEPSTGKPNVILCMADDQGWGDTGYNGHPAIRTPNLDAMAAAALRFDRFYAAAPVCSPTRGSVMTGRHPNRFGCFKWGYTLRPQEVTVAEALKSAGYVTGHFGKWHLGPVYKDSPVNPGASGFDEWLSAPNFYDNDPVLSRQGTAVALRGESSLIAADAAIEFIRKHVKGPRPFLAVVWFGSPHSPHKADEADLAPYRDAPSKRQNYYGEITGIDRAMGKLRNELRSLGIRDNTILWYCSDNGGVASVSVTGGRAGKGSIYEGGLRVPAILEWPAKVPAPRKTNLPCVTSDIYPTLLEIVGAKVDRQPPLDGVSLVGLLEGRMTSRSRPIGFWDFGKGGIKTASSELMPKLLEMQKAGQEMKDPAMLCLNAGKIDKQYPEDSFPGHAAWLDWPWKLHRIEKKGSARLELYNLADDPDEKQDLSGRQADRVKAMRADLEKWLVSVVASLNGKDYRP